MSKEGSENGKMETDLEAKLKLLKFTRDKTETVANSENILAMERQLKALNTVTNEVDSMRRKVEQYKFVKGKEPEMVAAWGEKIDEEITTTDAAITNLTNAITEVKSTHTRIEREKEHALKDKERQEQLMFEKQKYEMKLEFEKKLEESRAVKGQVYESKPHKTNSKLPGLKITKFNGNVSNWLGFWNKFEAEIDKSDLAPTTKFAYLKEMIEPKIRTEIDWLPFSSEGYERAKTILKSEYGKNSEIVNAYIQNIMSLPTITGSQPSKVHEFYKTLLFNVQSLETLGKLQEVKGNVRSVLDKLRGIKADLIRGQSGWQEWDFTQLVSALKEWKDINPIDLHEENKKKSPFSRQFQTQEQTQKSRGCVYCSSESH